MVRVNNRHDPYLEGKQLPLLNGFILNEIEADLHTKESCGKSDPN